jgi:hypothetical protein
VSGQAVLRTDTTTPESLRAAVVAALATVPYARPLRERIASAAFDVAWLAGLGRLVRADVLTWAEDATGVRCGPAALLRLLAHDPASARGYA